MKNCSMSIYIAIGLAVLFVASLFIEIKAQVTTGLSVAILLFTVAQMLDSQVSFWNEDLQNQVDVYNNVGVFNLSPENIMFAKAMFRYMDQPKKQRIMHVSATVLYGTSFAVLFLSFVLPLDISEQIGTSVTILSSALLFLSICIVDKQHERKAKWNELQMLAMITNSNKTEIDIEAQNEQDKI